MSPWHKILEDAVSKFAKGGWISTNATDGVPAYLSGGGYMPNYNYPAFDQWDEPPPESGPHEALVTHIKSGPQGIVLNIYSKEGDENVTTVWGGKILKVTDVVVAIPPPEMRLWDPHEVGPSSYEPLKTKHLQKVTWRCKQSCCYHLAPQRNIPVEYENIAKSHLARSSKETRELAIKILQETSDTLLVDGWTKKAFHKKKQEKKKGKVL